MFELLTKEQKNNVLKEYRLRKFVIATVFVAITAIVGSLLLVPALILSSSKANDLDQQLKAQNQNQEAKDVRVIRENIQEANRQISLLANRQEIKLTENIADVIISAPTGMRLISFGYNEATEGIRQLEIGGISPTRDSLLLFVKNIEQKEQFSDVNLPISDFAKDRDIPFSITIIVDEKES